MAYYRYGFFLLFAVSLVLFFAPIPSEPGAQFGFDKIVHAGIFAALAYCGIRAFPRARSAVFIFAVVYGFAVEYIQGAYFPLRHFDWHDIGADIVGSSIGLVTYLIERAGSSRRRSE